MSNLGKKLVKLKTYRDGEFVSEQIEERQVYVGHDAKCSINWMGGRKVVYTCLESDADFVGNIHVTTIKADSIEGVLRGLGAV